MNQLYAQRASSTVDSGEIKQAKFKINIPENWNNAVIMYAHGYNVIGSPPIIGGKSDSIMAQLFTGLGYAFARSEFGQEGWGLAEGVEDTERLRQYFIKKYGKPKLIFMAGTSMGGGIAVATAEKYGNFYDGTLAMCALSANPYDQVRQSFDLLAAFNVVFPNVAPSLLSIANGTAKMVTRPEIVKAIESDTIAAEGLSHHFFFRAKDLPFMIVFAQSLLKNIDALSGGNPFDNTNTVYSGYGPDLKIDLQVERLKALPGTQHYLTSSVRTGLIEKPMVMLHTYYDPLITPSMGIVNFDNKVNNAGNGQNLTVFFTPGEGHCQYTPKEITTAFESLVQWTRSGIKPRAGIIR